jgi:hypothetical protein
MDTRDHILEAAGMSSKRIATAIGIRPSNLGCHLFSKADIVRSLAS